MTGYTKAELEFGKALIDYFQSTARTLHYAFPGLCDADELHRLLDEALKGETK